MRYKLMTNTGDRFGFQELTGNRKKTKSEIDAWIAAKSVELGGVHWRNGCEVKFKNDPAEYRWVWVRDGQPVTFR